MAFLQGLVSNDVSEAVPGHAVWAALLTPQGKWLADFFIFADGERLLLDCERAQAAGVLQRLTRYRLRSRVALAAADDLCVYAAWDGTPDWPAISARDPRLPEAGWRLLAAEPLPTTALEADWDRHRLALVSRAHAERFDPAVLIALAYNPGLNTQERERHDGYDTANYHPRSEGVGRRASPQPVVSIEQSAAGPRFFIAGVSS